MFSYSTIVSRNYFTSNYITSIYYITSNYKSQVTKIEVAQFVKAEKAEYIPLFSGRLVFLLQCCLRRRKRLQGSSASVLTIYFMGFALSELFHAILISN